MKIKAAAKFLLIPFCCLLLSGCIKIVNLQDRAIVQGVGAVSYTHLDVYKRQP